MYEFAVVQAADCADGFDQFLRRSAQQTKKNLLAVLLPSAKVHVREMPTVEC
jgi:hypothetical protein